MKEIFFNKPLKIKESIKNVKKFLNTISPLHGPGENITEIKKNYLKSLVLKIFFSPIVALLL